MISKTTQRITWRSIGEKTSGWLILMLVLVLLALPRLPALGRFVTADEPAWGKNSAIFYYALSEKQYLATYQLAHPGVITMWAGAIAYHLKFPEFRRVGQLQLGDTKLFQIFQRHGPTPLEVLATARLVIVLFNLIALAIGFLLGRQLFGGTPTVLGFSLIAYNPFFVAHSRFLHVDGLLSTFMLVATLAYLSYLRRRRPAALVISGVFTGLSLLTKTPAAVLVPLFLLLTIVDSWFPKQSGEGSTIASWVKTQGGALFMLAMIAALVFFLLWPAMWVQPIETLSKMAGYSLASAEGEIGGAQFVQAYSEDVDPGSIYLHYYPLTYLWRSTPVTLLGIIFVTAAFILKLGQLSQSKVRFSVLGFLLYIFAFTMVMSLGAKKFDRYLLPVYLPLDLLSGLGWFAFIEVLGKKLVEIRRNISVMIVLGVVISTQMAFTWSHFPYYLSYYNPLLGGVRKAPETMMIGWGEGLNQAALYLKQIPNIQDKRIISWYALAFNWYSFTFGFESSSIPTSLGNALEYQKALQGVGYAVVYVNQWQRNLPEALFDYLSGFEPEQSIWIHGLEYVRIYKFGTD